LAKEIRAGMTEAEVIATLGRPPGFYASPDTSYLGSTPGCWMYPEGWTLPSGDIIKAWISDAGYISVEFRKDGRVAYSGWSPVFTLPRETTWESLCRKARRLFH
jgi:hypothetical protein